MPYKLSLRHNRFVSSARTTKRFPLSRCASATLSPRSCCQRVSTQNPPLCQCENIIQRLNDVQDAASHRAVIRVYDEAGAVIETRTPKRAILKEP